MIEYPPVAGEFETVAKLLEGYSIARFGDGEFKLIDGQGYFREPANEKLSAELLEVLQRPAANCLVAIPTMDPRGAKYDGWIRHQARFARIIVSVSSALSVVKYYSAFVTRPDSAPWINC